MTYPNRVEHSRLPKVLAIVAALAAPLLAFACSANDPPSDFQPTGPSSASSGVGGSGGEGGGLFDGGIESPLQITPIDPVLKLEVPLTGQTIQFACTETFGGNPAPGAEWSLSNLELGTIDSTGLFSPNGKRAGTVNVRCETPTATALTTLKVIIHGWDDKGGLTDAQKDVLKGPPGAQDPGWKFLYPYDKTVFPRGTLAPEVHLEGGQQGAGYYVQISAKDFEYEGFFGTASPTQLLMAQEAWVALTNSAGGTDVEVRVSNSSATPRWGPSSAAGASRRGSCTASSTTTPTTTRPRARSCASRVRARWPRWCPATAPCATASRPTAPPPPPRTASTICPAACSTRR